MTATYRHVLFLLLATFLLPISAWSAVVTSVGPEGQPPPNENFAPYPTGNAAMLLSTIAEHNAIFRTEGVKTLMALGKMWQSFPGAQQASRVLEPGYVPPSGTPRAEPGNHGFGALMHNYLEIYRQTPGPQTLEMLENISLVVMSWAKEDEIGGYWWETRQGNGVTNLDYNHGQAAIIEFLAEMHHITGKEIYKHYAVKGARWLGNMAVQEGDGYKWRHYGKVGEFEVSRCRGAAGIAMGLYAVYVRTGDESAKKYADGALRWLMQSAVKDEQGIHWPHHTKNDKKADASHGRGTAGIVNAFFTGHLASLPERHRKNIAMTSFGMMWAGDPVNETSEFLEYAVGGAEWLMNTAIDAGDGTIVWVTLDRKTPVPTETIYPWHCVGSGTTSMPLLKLYQLTGDRRYVKFVRGHLDWLMSLRHAASEEYIGPAWAYQTLEFYEERPMFLAVTDASVQGTYMAIAGRQLNEPTYIQGAKDIGVTLVAVRRTNEGKPMFPVTLFDEQIRQVVAARKQVRSEAGL